MAEGHGVKIAVVYYGDFVYHYIRMRAVFTTALPCNESS